MMQILNKSKRRKVGAIPRMLAVAVMVELTVLSGFAFSLNGPTAPWQTARLGYQPPAASWSIPGSGPMMIGEEYRWNVPTLYYSFTGDFLKFFGEKGSQEIERAAAMMNSIPAAASINPDDYPLTSMRVNSRASALGLIDLYSVSLSLMLNYVGPSDSTIFVWCLRERWVTAGPTINFYTFSRNFDPDTWLPTPYVNGVLWTYSGIVDLVNPPISFTVNTPVVPNTYQSFRNSPVSSILNAPNTLLSGSLGVIGGYWNNFTRDDMAAMKFIYRSLNVHAENVGGTNTIGGAATGPVAGGGGSGSSPYGLPVFNGTGTGSPYGNPGVVITNTSLTNLVTATNAVAVLGGAGPIDTGVRGGIEKLTLQRANFDSLLGANFTPFNTAYAEIVYVNGRAVSQVVTRSVVSPEFIWDAGDIQGGDTGTPPGFAGSLVYTAPHYVDNNALNGLNSAFNFGPGTFTPTNGPSMQITFNTTGNLLYNTIPGAGTSESAATLIPLNWGSYDGTTNAPLIYPNRQTIEDLERRVLTGR